MTFLYDKRLFTNTHLVFFRFCALSLDLNSNCTQRERKKCLAVFFCSHSKLTIWHFPLEQRKKKYTFFLSPHEQRCFSNEAQRLNDFIMAVARLFIPSDTFYLCARTCDTHTDNANASATNTNTIFYRFLLRRTIFSRPIFAIYSNPIDFQCLEMILLVNS